ncbi:MAG: type II CAAX prenyl endopeptidase Rce1 family protein [Bacteroidota bacterium]
MMEKYLAELKKYQTFKDFSETELKNVLPYFKLIEVKKGNVLVWEGSNDCNDLFIVLDGELEVIKDSLANLDDSLSNTIVGNFKIAEIHKGDTFGELALFGSGIRTATIKAIRNSVLLKLSAQNFKIIKDKLKLTYGKMVHGMMVTISQRLSLTSEHVVSVLQSQLDQSKKNARANIFFSYIIGTLCVYNLMIDFISRLSESNGNIASAISAVIIVIFSLILVLMIKRTNLPAEIFGLNTSKWKFALRESILWTVGIVGSMILLKWYLVTYVVKYQHLPVIDFHPLDQKYLFFNFMLYGFHSPIQEFIARGVLQGSLQRFFNGNNVTFRAILVSNALFAATHVHLMGGLLAIIVFIPGLFWGWLYSRHGNLIGVSISHILIGWTGFFFLNLESLF